MGGKKQSFAKHLQTVPACQILVSLCSYASSWKPNQRNKSVFLTTAVIKMKGLRTEPSCFRQCADNGG